ncbi:MAG: ABC transporter permease [Actinomycetota bacterium]|nr:ABC transporter permease [Actinomycetota bacterium]
MSTTALGVHHDYEPGMVERARWALADARVMTRRYLLQLIRIPTVLFFSLIQPVMFVLLFRYVFGGAIHTAGVNYAEYMLPGAIAQTASFASFGTAIGLAYDLGRGLIDRVRSMPAARFAVLAGRLSSDVVRSLAVVLVLVAVGYGVGFRFDNGAGPAILMILLSVLFGLAICTIAAFVGLALKDPEAVQSFGLVWLFPLTFVSGAFVPVATMPGWLQAIARPNPVTLVVDVMRSLAYGGPIAAHLLESLAWIVGILLVFAPLAVRAFKRAS